jgi:hypothetical protein
MSETKPAKKPRKTGKLPGRPPNKLEHRFQVRCTLDERDAWEKCAGDLNLGEYTRLCVRVARGEATHNEIVLLNLCNARSKS